MGGNEKGFIAPGAGRPNKTPRTILIVDDDVLVLESLKQGLSAGCCVLCAESVAAAGEHLERMPQPDIAIVDVIMPGGSGFDLIPRLQSNAIPFVMLSAHSEPPIVQQATAAGALAYLVKPVDAVRLLPAIEAALACAAKLAELKNIHGQLQNALDGDRDTSVAVGVTMVQREIGRVEAFDLLRGTARNQRRKLTELAREIVEAQEMLNQAGSALARDPGKETP